MSMLETEQEVKTFEFVRDEVIESPIDIVFQSVLDEMGPEGTMPNGQSLSFKIEPWPGGRWYRDLGNNNGHLWGHVQVIKAPTLIEVSGPMFMSYPAMNHMQYKLVAEGNATRLKLTHKSFGLIPEDHRSGMGSGWTHIFKSIKERAARKTGK